MPIYFITKRNDHLISDKSITIVNDLSILLEYLTYNKEIGYDKEFSSLNIFRAIPLLTQIGDKNVQFVIDETSIDSQEIGEMLPNLLLIGHNLKIDYKIHRLQGFSPFRNIFDTMIAEQVITRGCGYSNTLNHVIQRRLDIPPLAKEIGTSFVGMTKRSVFTDKHIIYAADDIKHLHDVKEIQEEYIKKGSLHKDLYEIDFLLVTILGDAELKGCKLDEVGWRKNIQDNRDKILKLENEMNSLLLELKEVHKDLSKVYIKRITRREQTIQADLFADPNFVETTNNRGINFNAPKQVLRLFELMGLEKPVVKKKNSKTGVKETSPSIKEEALENYLNANRPWLDYKVIQFIDSLVQYKKTLKNINSFGERFLVEAYKKGAGGKAKKNIVPGFKSLVTGKVHTIYFQSGLETPRMSSGNAGRRKHKTDPLPEVAYFNSQNIPKPNTYRHCFIADDLYSITTCDLSGAELVIAADLSNDKRLMELVQGDDIHSPLATTCYNAIIDFILGNMIDRRAREELSLVFKADTRLLEISEEEGKAITKDRVDYIMRFRNTLIDDKDYSDIRTHFKNVVYGLSYGASADRIMEILGLSKVYAEIVERAMKAELPDFFAYQEKTVEFVLKNGYLQFHPDYGSKHIFTKVMDYKRWNKELPFNIKGEVERASKNYPSQGTQGLMIKRATVEYFYDYVYPNNYDVNLIFQIHDENVIHHLTSEPQHGVVLSEIMNETANKFLKTVKMKSKYVTMNSWHK